MVVRLVVCDEVGVVVALVVGEVVSVDVGVVVVVGVVVPDVVWVVVGDVVGVLMWHSAKVESIMELYAAVRMATVSSHSSLSSMYLLAMVWQGLVWYQRAAAIYIYIYIYIYLFD